MVAVMVAMAQMIATFVVDPCHPICEPMCRNINMQICYKMLQQFHFINCICCHAHNQSFHRLHSLKLFLLPLGDCQASLSKSVLVTSNHKIVQQSQGPCQNHQGCPTSQPKAGLLKASMIASFLFTVSLSISRPSRRQASKPFLSVTSKIISICTPLVSASNSA